jgi:hypothetical protein
MPDEITVDVPLSIARLINSVFLPVDPYRLRKVGIPTMEAVAKFKDLLADAETLHSYRTAPKPLGTR